jgi:hypothetical protein
MLQEILGFFIIEHRVAHTTREFRSKARVCHISLLWLVLTRLTCFIDIGGSIMDNGSRTYYAYDI